ncbi:MAG: PBP1b-binding outer membrane lipoprotein LpoB [Cyclobacteriaceae bacterium]
MKIKNSQRPMKNNLTIALLALILSACGGASNSNEKQSESTFTDEIINNIDEQKNELIKTTDETLIEVDSLLENL